MPSSEDNSLEGPAQEDRGYIAPTLGVRVCIKQTWTISCPSCLGGALLRDPAEDPPHGRIIRMGWVAVAGGLDNTGPVRLEQDKDNRGKCSTQPVF